MAIYGDDSDLVSQFFWVTFTEACQEAFKTSIIFIKKEDLAAFLNSPALIPDKSFKHATNFLRYLARRIFTKRGDKL